MSVLRERNQPRTGSATRGVGCTMRAKSFPSVWQFVRQVAILSRAKRLVGTRPARRRGRPAPAPRVRTRLASPLPPSLVTIRQLVPLPFSHPISLARKEFRRNDCACCLAGDSLKYGGGLSAI